MSIFDSIHVRGFRRLHDVDLKLGPLNVVIGANGGGKTSLLEVFSLLAASAAGRLKETLSKLGGIDSNLTNLATAKGGKAGALELELATSEPKDAPMRYLFTLSPSGAGYEIFHESLIQNPDSSRLLTFVVVRRGAAFYPAPRRLERPTWDYDPTESALSQIPKMFLAPEEFRKRLASSTHYHVLDVGPFAPIRMPQHMRDARLPGRDGEDLVSCLYSLRETDQDRFETIEATLRAAFPAFERLNFPPVAAGVLAMTWKDKTSNHPFYMHQLSEGTLRFLWLASLLQSPGLTAVTMIDEPEVSLHPELLSLLADLFREASRRTQLIVATHSDRLIRFLKPSEVVTIDVNDEGAAEATRADELDLEKWLEDYTMDELWQMGRMGARP